MTEHEIPMNLMNPVNIFPGNRHAEQRNILACPWYFRKSNNADRESFILCKTRIFQDLGEVEIGLRYLPTSERLSVTVLRATNLKVTNEKKSGAYVFLRQLKDKFF